MRLSGTVKGAICACVRKIGGGESNPRGWVGEGGARKKNMFKLISCSLDGDRACLFSDWCVERGWEELEETGMRRNGTFPFVSWATVKLRAALLLCVCLTSAGELLTMAAAAAEAGWGLSLDLDASNGCGSRRSSSTEERWNTTRFSTPASCYLLSMSINTMEPVATSNNASRRLSYSSHGYGSLYFVTSVVVLCLLFACLSLLHGCRRIMLFTLHQTGVKS